jgi:hypothetical protein
MENPDEWAYCIDDEKSIRKNIRLHPERSRRVKPVMLRIQIFTQREKPLDGKRRLGNAAAP